MKRCLALVVRTLFASALLGSLVLTGCGRLAPDPRLAEARAQARRWAEKLDAQTTPTGTYIRHPVPQLPEDDPWGTALTVVYSQDGVSETLLVRSAGPDRTFYTDDDIQDRRIAVNLRGVGKAVGQHVEEMSRKGGRGTVKGIAEGVKAGVQESSAKKKAKDQDKQP